MDDMNNRDNRKNVNDSTHPPLGKLEQLEADVARLSEEIRDPVFSGFLQGAKNKLITQKYQADLLREDLDRNLQRYRERTALVKNTDPAARAVLAASDVSEKASADFYERVDRLPTGQSENGLPAEQSMDSLPIGQGENGLQAEQNMNNLPIGQSENGLQAEQNTDNLPIGQSENGLQAEQNTDNLPIGQGENVLQAGKNLDRLSAGRSAANPQTGRNAEFVLGATILGMIGGIFILVALVTFSMNFMSDPVKGIGLYALCLSVLLFSELFLYRRFQGHAVILSSVSAGGLYIVTAVNYLSLHILNLWAALGISAVVSLLLILLSRRRDSLPYRIIGVAASYLSFFMIQSGITGTEFLVISVMFLCINVLNAVLPVRGKQTACRITHMAFNAAFTWFFSMRALYCGVSGEMVLVFEIFSVLILHILFVAQILYRRREAEEAAQRGVRAAGNAGALTAYCLCAVAHIFDIGSMILEIRPYTTYLFFFSYGVRNGLDRELTEMFARTCGHAAMLSILVIGLVSFLMLKRRDCRERWFIYYFLNIAPWGIYLFEERTVTYTILLVLLIVSKLLSLKKIREVRVVDAVLTTLVCLFVAWGQEPEILLIGVAVAILCLSQWRTYHEILLTAALTLYLAPKLPDSLVLPATVGILFVGILLFNNVRRWRDRHILVYNVLSVAAQSLCFIYLPFLKLRLYGLPFGRAVEAEEAYIIYLFMLIFGLATIVLTFTEKYQMGIRGKWLIVTGFLTYMVLVLPTRETILVSILLMVIALGCVGCGFGRHLRPVRLYGLALSLAVCAKLVFYDFLEVPVFQRTILFFIVGVIALIIAGIYIILEKRDLSGERKRRADEPKPDGDRVDDPLENRHGVSK